ncbi:MAG TPA: hypothetical protein VLT87_20015 [Thermoanaerobaculia bacterium]|nr:hypothetical protein [Thermoanaerobaculia bacterium]
MADLRAAGLSRREAAVKAARALGGHPEALRKHYRELERSGGLPAGAPPLERIAQEIREHHRLHTERIEADRLEIAALENEAQSLGLDLKDARFGDLLTHLSRRQEHLESLTTAQDTARTYYYLRSEGFTTPEEIIAHLDKAAHDLHLIKRQIEVVRRLRHLRPETWGS